MLVGSPFTCYIFISVPFPYQHILEHGIFDPFQVSKFFGSAWGFEMSKKPSILVDGVGCKCEGIFVY